MRLTAPLNHGAVFQETRLETGAFFEAELP